MVKTLNEPDKIWFESDSKIQVKDGDMLLFQMDHASMEVKYLDRKSVV